MVISSLRLPFSLWLPKLPIQSFRFSKPILPLRLNLIYCSSSISSSAQQTSTHLDKWQSVRKKKVVLRVGYVGSDYRGPFQISQFLLLIYYIKVRYFHCVLPFYMQSSIFYSSLMYLLSGLQMQRDEHSLSSKFLHPCPGKIFF